MLQRYEKVGQVPRLVLQGSDDHFNGKLTNDTIVKTLSLLLRRYSGAVVALGVDFGTIMMMVFNHRLHS
jgi:hypothetical protein